MSWNQLISELAGAATSGAQGYIQADKEFRAEQAARDEQRRKLTQQAYADIMTSQSQYEYEAKLAAWKRMIPGFSLEGLSRPELHGGDPLASALLPAGPPELGMLSPADTNQPVSSEQMQKEIARLVPRTTGKPDPLPAGVVDALLAAEGQAPQAAQAGQSASLDYLASPIPIPDDLLAQQLAMAGGSGSPLAGSLIGWRPDPTGETKWMLPPVSASPSDMAEAHRQREIQEHGRQRGTREDFMLQEAARSLSEPGAFSGLRDRAAISQAFDSKSQDLENALAGIQADVKESPGLKPELYEAADGKTWNLAGMNELAKLAWVRDQRAMKASAAKAAGEKAKDDENLRRWEAQHEIDKARLALAKSAENKPSTTIKSKDINTIIGFGDADTLASALKSWGHSGIAALKRKRGETKEQHRDRLTSIALKAIARDQAGLISQVTNKQLQAQLKRAGAERRAALNESKTAEAAVRRAEDKDALQNLKAEWEKHGSLEGYIAELKVKAEAARDKLERANDNWNEVVTGISGVGTPLKPVTGILGREETDPAAAPAAAPTPAPAPARADKDYGPREGESRRGWVDRLRDELPGDENRARRKRIILMFTPNK